MTWFKVDDGFWRHAKVRKLGTKDRVAAVGVWTLAGNWSADNTTDGFVPREQVEVWDPKCKLADRLVAVGLWRHAEQDGEKGYRFHQWSEFQPTRESIEAEREAWRRRKAAQRARKSPRVSPEDTPGDGEGDVPGGHPEGVPRMSGTRPVPSRSSPDGEERDSLRSSRPARRPTPAELDRDAHSDHARRLIDDYAATCKARPSATVRRRLGPGVDELLAEGWPDHLIAGALAFWRDKGLDPKTFPSVANEFANRNPTGPGSSKPSTTDQRVAAAQALKDLYPDSPDQPGPLQITGR